MPYAQAYTDALREKKLSGLFVNDYFMPNKVINSMRFRNGAVVNNAGGYSYLVNRNSARPLADIQAAKRAPGNDFTIKNSSPVPETFYLGHLGGKYQVDIERNKIVGGVLTENEAREQMALAANSFVYQLIFGTGTSNEGFIGMDTYVKAVGNSNMIITAKGDLKGVLTEAQCLSYLSWFNDVAGDLDVDANSIWCSKAFANRLATAQSILRKQTETITINSLTYQSFLDLAINPIPNSFGLKEDIMSGATKTGEQENFFIGRIDEEDGVFCASPTDMSAFVNVVPPVQSGSPLATGYVDWATCFIPKKKGALRKATVVTL